MSIWEVLLISLVALIVIGPERLPKLLLSVSRLFNKVQGFSAGIKKELEEQLKHEQLKDNQKRAESADEEYQEITNK